MAEEAKRLGLIDEIGYQDDAIAFAKQTTGVGEKVRIVTYVRPLDNLLSLFEGNASSAVPRDLTRLLELQVPRLMMMPTAAMGSAKY
jgi:ClpP class serine protease